ncbi:MAG: tRNA-dihydrouridine synthase family protein [Clostridia bacterium]|nr:tRNA-dihydrouridine synthase family protein [Clostridia bacterium]
MFSELYCAPMEGVTRALFRQQHHALFGGCDQYFTPFLAPSADGIFSEKELREVRPEACAGVPTVPQLLVARPEHFLWAAKLMGEMGYRQVDLNLGCPSGTVVAKHKGSGMLADPDALDRFFDEVFRGLPDGMTLSVKTRIGLEDRDNWPALLAVFDRYPIGLLTVHPRLRRQFYKGKPDGDAFALALEQVRLPLCWNGDIFTPEDARLLKERFPSVERVMLGRGLVANPALARQLRGGAPLSGGELRQFHDGVLEGYCACILGEVNVLHKMKELWNYWACLYPEDKKGVKALRKSRDLAGYRRAAAAVLAAEPAPNAGFFPETF